MTLTNTIHPHPETHFTGSEFVRDIVIGMSDGLTVPFAPNKRVACLIFAQRKY